MEEPGLRRVVALRLEERRLAKRGTETGLLGTESLWPLGHLSQLSDQTQPVPGRQAPEGVLNGQARVSAPNNTLPLLAGHLRTFLRVPALPHPGLCVCIPSADKYLLSTYFMPRMELGSEMWL